MVDLSSEMAELWGSLSATGNPRARVIQLVAARRGEGSSTVARELAFHVALQARLSVWLVDMDLAGPGQVAAIRAQAERYGQLGAPASASPDGSSFLTVQPPVRGADGKTWPASRYLTAYRVGEARWWATRFQREAVQTNQTLHILPGGEYWAALRRYADLIIIDAPSADRSRAAITVAPHVDQTVLVAAADQSDVKATTQLRDAIGQGGGPVAGLFFNRVTANPPGFLRALGV